MGSGSELICLDTQVLVYGVQGRAPEAMREEKERATYFIENALEHNFRLVVPSIAIAEFLCGFQPNQHREVMAQLLRQFQVAPFDERASLVLAQLWKESRIFPKSKPNSINTRALIADHQVVATAIAFGCKKLISYDKGDIVQIAGSRIEICSTVPRFPQQGSLGF